jgi:hypothetical protein
MPEIMINKMSKFPDNVAIDKPIPGKLNIDYGVLLKNTNTYDCHSDGQVSANDRIKHIGEKRYLIGNNFKLLVKQSPE